MGKAKVLENAGEGFYLIQPILKTDKQETRLEDIKEQLATLEAKRNNLREEIDRLSTRIREVEEKRNEILQDPDSYTDPHETVQELTEEISRAAAQQGNRRQALEEVKRYITDLRSTRARIQEMLDPPTALAACADYTTDIPIGTEVGTIERARQSARLMGPGWRPIIQPGGYNGEYAYDPERDGIIEPAAGTNPAGTVYNMAMEAGARAWLPIYREARIIRVQRQDDRADISIDLNFSRITGAGSSPDEPNHGFGRWNAVPVDYMDCNARVFKEGDKVVVAFNRRTTGESFDPKVIGFADGPKRCAFVRVAFGLGQIESEWNEEIIGSSCASQKCASTGQAGSPDRRITSIQTNLYSVVNGEIDGERVGSAHAEADHGWLPWKSIPSDFMAIIATIDSPGLNPDGTISGHLRGDKVAPCWMDSSAGVGQECPEDGSLGGWTTYNEGYEIHINGFMRINPRSFAGEGAFYWSSWPDRGAGHLWVDFLWDSIIEHDGFYFVEGRAKKVSQP